MARRLTRLQLDEVSVVDSGAGRGVDIVLTKRDRDLSPKAVRERIAKVMDEWRYDQAIAYVQKNDRAEPTHHSVSEQTLAKQAAATISHLVAKGMSFDQAATVAHHAEKLAKRGQNTVRYYQVTPGNNGDGMDGVDWNDDIAATKAHRAEQARKTESAQGSHTGENGRRSRNVTAAT
jgi:hypothetical protein